MKQIKTLIITGDVKTVAPGVRQSDLGPKLEAEVNAALQQIDSDDVVVDIQFNFPTPSTGGSALAVITFDGEPVEDAEDSAEETAKLKKGAKVKKGAKNDEGGA